MKDIRNSNFEALRIIAILMITAYHYVVHGVGNMAIGGGNVLYISSLWGKAGVDIFCLLTGYMLVTKENVNYKRLVNVELQILFYTFLGLGVGLLLGKSVGIGSLLKTFMPVTFEHYWYMTAYVIVFLLSPYFNTLIKTFDKKTFERLLIIFFVVWCIIPFFTLRENNGLFWSQLIWFVVMYFTGAYIRLMEPRFTKRFYIHILWISNVLLVLSVISIGWLAGYNERFAHYIVYFRWSNSPLIVMICVAMMRLAAMAKFRSVGWINFLASLVLGIYLFQENIFFQEICWHDWFNNSIPSTVFLQIIHVITSVACVCVLGGLIEFLRIQLFKLLRLSK